MESSAAVSLYIPQNSKKRVFPGGSSKGCKEAEIVEISPPINRASKAKSSKQKEVICQEIIDVDMEEDCDDAMLIDGHIDTSGKGKEVLSNFSHSPSSLATIGPGNCIQPSDNGTTGLHNFVHVDDFNSSLLYADDDYIDMYYDDLIFDDEHAVLQSHFDHMDIPPGVEAQIPWLPSSAGNNMKLTTDSSSTNSSSQLQLGTASLPPGTSSSHPPLLLKPIKRKDQSTSLKNSKLDDQVHAVSQPMELKMSSPLWKPALNQENSATTSSATYLTSEITSGLLNQKHGKNRSLGKSKRKSYAPQTLPYYGSLDQFLPGSTNFSNSVKAQVGSGGSYPNLNVPMNTPGAGNYMPVWNNWTMNVSGPLVPLGVMSESLPVPWGQNPAQGESDAFSKGTSELPTKVEHRNVDEILENFDLLKQFDTVEDYCDHHYSKNGSSMKQLSNSWAKRIQEEWKILEKDLPDTIFVRVYESRMDLLRAVIVGAEGTPYHDGLFFFDVFFPSSYPNVPPHVYYYSGGLRINPNLYNCGKVCLSLLNTWSGSQKEKWIPGVSTMLQVLVSIQGLILNAKPYFNEPGYANMSGSASGEKCSVAYNEKTFIHSLQTMVYNMRRPPKYFEDYVVGHFCKRARDILVACKAYMEGAQVGCLVKGGVQDVDEGDKSCSQDFKTALAGFITTLVNTFSQIGVKDCQEFLSLAQKANVQVSNEWGQNFYGYAS